MARMWSTTRKIFGGFRNHGWAYVAEVASNEIIHPRFAPTLIFRKAVIAFLDRVWKRPSEIDRARMDCLQFVCDLNVCSATFDFASYLAAAEIERRRRGLKALQVVFVPRSERGLYREMSTYEEVIGLAACEWRVQHILVAMLALLPSVSGHIVCSRREEADALISRDPAYLYPDDYRTYLARQPATRVIHDRARQGTSIFPMFRATARAREFVAQFLSRFASARKPVVI